MYHDGISLAEQSDIIWRRLSRLVGQKLHDIPVKATRRVIFYEDGLAELETLREWPQSRGNTCAFGNSPHSSAGGVRGEAKSNLQCKMRRPTPNDVCQIWITSVGSDTVPTKPDH